MRISLTCILFILIRLAFGQSIANYTTTRATGISYSSIALTGSAFASWRNTTSFTQDDNRSNFTDIGFDYWYNGIRYTQFCVSTNGFLDFSSSAADGGPSGADYSFDNTFYTENGSGTWNALAPFYDDMTAQGGVDPLGSSIKYLLSGTAPNRVLTVEWINMAVFGNVTPSLNFQVKLYETTGVIEYVYGTMTQGTHTFSYTCGINAAFLNNNPTATQLKAQQTANTTTFNFTEQNNLVTIPATNSKITFTPPTPAVPAGSLTFTAVSPIAMTLNWTNWATNEVGYVIYRSTDNITFTFVSQTALNATSAVVSGLSPSTTYYWRVYAVTEGRLSTALTGTQATTAAGTKVSNASGSWNTAGIWTPPGVPTITDNVTISNTHTVTIDANATCNKLTIGVSVPSTLLIGNNAMSRTINVTDTIRINTGSSFSVTTTSNTTHSILVNGNIINNGTINFATDANSLCNATFQKNGNITVSGTGATTTFNTLSLNMGSAIANTVEFTTPSFAAAATGFLTLTTGTLKISTTGASNTTPFAGAATIPVSGSIWLNSAASTMSFGASVTLTGDLVVSAGTMNVGNAINEDLLANGGQITISGGTLNVAGKYYPTSINNISKFTISAGSMIVPALGSTSTTIAPFSITSAGSQFNMSGGSIIIPREGGSGAQDLGFVNTGTSGGIVTGGTLQIGNGSSPGGQIIQINSTYPIGSLFVNSANVTARLLTNSLSVVNNVTLTAGTFNTNLLNCSLGGNWTNNGGIFIPSTGIVTFLGIGAQAINGTVVAQTFNNIVIAKTAGTLLSVGGSTTTLTTNNLTETTGDFTAPLTLNITGTTTASLLLSSGTFTAGLNTFITGNWTNDGGTFVPGIGTVSFTGIGAQAINGTAASQTFNHVVIAKTAGTTLSTGGSTTALTTNNLTETTGNFTAPATLNITAGAASTLTLGTGTFTAGAATSITGDWTNNGGIFVPGTGIVTFSGTGAQGINGTAASQTFNDVIVAKTAGTTLSAGGSTTTITTNNYTQTTGNFTAPANFNVSLGTASNVLLSAGTLTLPAANLTTITGNWTNNGATHTPNTSTVTFTGTTPQTIFKSGGETFNNVAFSNAGTKTLNSPITANANFTINTNAVFDVNASNHLVTIKGNFTNDGSLVARSGNVFMNGVVAQTIGGTTTTSFYDLTLDNNAGAMLTQHQNIIDALVLNNGVFNVNGRNFTLISTATGSGRIAQITGTGDITGNVIVQRFAPGGYTGWAYLGSPITSALTYTAWDDDIPISCSTCPDGAAGGFMSIYTYNETATGVYDDPASYIPITSINNPINNGVGYWVYLGNGFTTTTNITMDLTGTVRKFNYTIPLTYTPSGGATEDGWNLIANPYPSPIRWSLLRGATAGIDNAIYVYNADLNGGTGTHATFVNGISSPAVGAGGISDIIPIGQGFYVHSTGATGLNAQEANKIGGNPTFLRQLPGNTNDVATVPPAMMRLYIDGLSYHDETVLYLQPGANNGFDLQYDSYKLTGGDPLAAAIALQHDTDLFQVNGVAPITANFSMPVMATTGYAGNYTITADDISSFPAGACITLYDSYTGITTDLRNSNYAFTLSDTTLSARFTLNITMNPLQVTTSTNDPTCSQPNSGYITAVGTNAGPWNYFWKDDNGTVLQTSLNMTTADTFNVLTGGTYLLDINTAGSCDNNTTQFTIGTINVPNADFTCEDTVYINTGATVNMLNYSSNAASNNWNFGDGTGTSADLSPIYTYAAAGTYLITLITESSTACMDTASQTVVVVASPVGIKSLAAEGQLIIKTLSEDEYIIQQKLGYAQLVSLKLYDGIGKLTVDYGSSKMNMIDLDLNLHNYAGGVYYLKICTDAGTRVVKLVKQ